MTPEIKNRIEQIRQSRVPEGWEPVPLGSLGTAKNGLNYNRESTGFIIKILGVGDFKDKSVLTDVSSLQAVSLSTRPDSDYFLKDGDIVFVRSNGSKELVGRNLLVYPGINPVTYSGFCIRFRITPDVNTIPEFINLFLDNGALKRQLVKENQGSNINNLNQDILRKIIILLPPIKEQQKIGAILTVQDKIIELKESLLTAKQRQKKFLMQQLLTGKKRLPGFSDPWKKIKLSQILTERTEKNEKQQLRICSVAVQKGVVDQVEHLGRSYAAADTSSYGVAYYGDIVYTKSPTGDFPYGIIKQSQLNEKVAVSPLYGIYRPISFEMGYLLHTYFAYAVNAKNYLLPVVQKGAKNTINITNSGFISNSLYLPMDPKEQSTLAEVFIVADKEIRLLQQSIEQEKQKKKALMQLLLTGIVRVSI